MPKVSVLIPAYNEENNIAKCLESIYNQTFKDFEIVVIDDGSLDSTSEIIRSFRTGNLTCFKNEKNIGISKSLNLGLSFCKGKYIARIDADDIALPERLALQNELLDTNLEIALCGGWGITRNQVTKEENISKPPTDYLNIKKHMQKDNPFIHSTVMFRKRIIEELGGYGPIKGFEDYDLWIRVASKFKVQIIPEILVVRTDNNNFQWKKTWEDLSRKEVYKSRLFFQKKAVQAFGYHPFTIFYLLKTLSSLTLCHWRNGGGNASA